MLPTPRSICDSRCVRGASYGAAGGARGVMTNRLPPWVEIGFVTRAHGVRGELRMGTYDPESTVLGNATVLRLGDREFPVVKARAVNDGYLVIVEGIADRNAADALRGAVVAVPRAEIELDDGQVLLSDLVGCTVELVDGTRWGVVIALELGFQDRLVVRDDRFERLVPVVDELLVEIDVANGRIVIDVPEGMPETRL